MKGKIGGPRPANTVAEKRETTSLYFAYGSNLHMDQMAARCPGSEPLSKCKLPDWRLVFRGVADIEPCHRDHVQGAIYVITDECERALDRYEGWPRLYRKEYFMVRLASGVETVMFYRMNNDKTISPPPAGYFEVIAEGFKHWGLEMRKLTQAARRAVKGRNGSVRTSWGAS